MRCARTAAVSWFAFGGDVDRRRRIGPGFTSIDRRAWRSNWRIPPG